MSEMRRRHASRELGLIKFIARHQAAGLRFVLIGQELRRQAIPLWREGLVEVWYRQIAGEQPSLRGPHYALSVSGQRLAQKLLDIEFPAPRGFSGAGE